MAFRGKYTGVYETIEGDVFIRYVRICPIETDQYPHGLALATKCTTQEEAERFAKLVDNYLDEWIESIKDESQTKQE